LLRWRAEWHRSIVGRPTIARGGGRGGRSASRAGGWSWRSRSFCQVTIPAGTRGVTHRVRRPRSASLSIWFSAHSFASFPRIRYLRSQTRQAGAGSCIAPRSRTPRPKRPVNDEVADVPTGDQGRLDLRHRVLRDIWGVGPARPDLESLLRSQTVPVQAGPLTDTLRCPSTRSHGDDDVVRCTVSSLGGTQEVIESTLYWDDGAWRVNLGFG